MSLIDLMVILLILLLILLVGLITFLMSNRSSQQSQMQMILSQNSQMQKYYMDQRKLEAETTRTLLSQTMSLVNLLSSKDPMAFQVLQSTTQSQNSYEESELEPIGTDAAEMARWLKQNPGYEQGEGGVLVDESDLSALAIGGITFPT